MILCLHFLYYSKIAVLEAVLTPTIRPHQHLVHPALHLAILVQELEYIPVSPVRPILTCLTQVAMSPARLAFIKVSIAALLVPLLVLIVKSLP